MYVLNASTWASQIVDTIKGAADPNFVSIILRPAVQALGVSVRRSPRSSDLGPTTNTQTIQAHTRARSARTPHNTNMHIKYARLRASTTHTNA